MIAVTVTIKDIAKYTGLSLATISKYLNGGNVLEHNRILIKEAIEKLNFRVNEMARGLKTNRTRTIGVLIPDLTNVFCTTVISNIENILLQEGYSTIICDYRNNPELETEKLNFLVNKMVDGIVMMPLSMKGPKVREVLKEGIPIVLIDRLIPEIECDVVLVDNLNASYHAVEELIVRGHKRIGIIVGPQKIFTAEERLKGYLRVYEDYNLKLDSDLIKYGNYQMQSGYDLFNELIQLPEPPTAVYATNYDLTLGVIIAINKKNIKIPEDLSFIGFDNLELAKIVKPSLSIVVQPMQQIGKVAAETLLLRLQGDQTGFPTVSRLKTDILIKESVAKI